MLIRKHRENLGNTEKANNILGLIAAILVLISAILPIIFSEPQKSVNQEMRGNDNIQAGGDIKGKEINIGPTYNFVLQVYNYNSDLSDQPGEDPKKIKFDQARKLQSKYKYEEAIKEYQKLFAQVGDNLDQTIEIHVSIGNCYYEIALWIQALGEYKEAQRLSEKNENYSALAVIHNNIGVILAYQREFDEALENFNKSLDILDKKLDPLFKITIINNIGATNCWLGNENETLNSFNESLKLSKNISYKLGEANTYLNLGGTYLKWGLYDKSTEYLNYAFNLNKELGDSLINARILNSQAQIYKMKGQYLEAIQLCEKVRNILNEKPIERLMAGSNLLVLGQCYLNLNEIEKAHNFLQESLKIFKKIGDRWNEEIVIGSIADTYLSEKKYDKAFEKYKERFRIAGETRDINGQAQALNGQGVIYIEQGHYENAIKILNDALDLQKQEGPRSNEVVIMFNLSIAYEKLGNLQEAIKTMKDVVELDKQNNLPDLQKHIKYLDFLQNKSKR